MTSKKGSSSLYLVIIVLLLLEGVLFGLLITGNNHTSSNERQNYLETKVDIYNIEEEIKKRALNFTNITVAKSLEKLEKIKEIKPDITEEELISIYNENILESYSKNINHGGKYITEYISSIQGIKNKYEYKNYDIEVKVLEEIKDELLEKNYRIRFTLETKEDDKGHLRKNLYLHLKIPSYDKAINNIKEIEPIKIYYIL